MNNKFALSFGISLVIVGFLNIFFETNNIILFGLSVSTTIFSCINIIVPKINSDKSELLFIIPFVLLVSIFCYSNSLIKFAFIREIVNGKTPNVLTFISFGFLFVSEFFNHKKNKLSQRIFEMERVNQDYEYSNMILMIINDYIANLTKNGTAVDTESMNFLHKIENLCLEKSTLADIDSDLLKLNKDNYSIQDFNKFYKLNNSTINYEKTWKEYNKKMKKR